MTLDPNLPSEPPTGAPPNLDETWAAGGAAKGIRVRLPLAIAVLAVVAMLGIFGGAQLKSSNASATVASTGGTTRNRGQFSGGPGGAGGAGGRGGATAGTVQSVNGNTIAVTDAQGQTKTVTLESGTTITKSTTGSASDITTGETIVVRGTANSDGSTTAQSVSIGNGGFGGFGGPGGGGPPPDTASSSAN